MKYFKTKHEKDSAKITTLIMLILVLLLFVVGQDYKVQPEEYGVAINFGDSALGGGNVLPDKTEDIIEQPQEEIKAEEIEEAIEEIVEEEVLEESKEEEINEEELAEEKAAEEKAIKETEEAKKEAEAAEKLLLEEAEEAEKLKAEKEAQQKAEAEAKEAKEKAEKAAKAKAKTEAEAKEAAAKAKAATAAKAKADAEAKAKSAAEAKAKADAKAEAKAAADAKAAAAKKAKEGAGETPFALIEIAPIYPGCEGGNNEARKNCMNEKIKQFINDNYDTDLASDLTGIQKINISFKINTSGKVVSINARASDPKLEAEAKRVINLLPKMKPGMQQGSPVVVSYGLPIRIKMKD